MSVSETLTLPAQPPDGGSVVRVPLGGDGLQAPHSAYSVRAANITMDASSGIATMDINLDDRFCSLVSFVTVVVDGNASDQVVKFQISGASTPSIIDHVLLTGFGGVAESANVWYPPTWVLPGAGEVCDVRVIAANTDGDDMQVSLVVYNFDIRVRELTNIGFLGWSRGPVAS